ncbi:AraC family transcriptional regulator, partial [Pseudoxanthomonas sp. SGD-10]
MKPHLLKIPLNPEHSFNIRYDIVPHFYKMWHYHQEVELVYIVKGSGVQFIAENIHYFKPGDLIMFGSFLPHLWRSDEKYLQPDSEEKVEAIVLHFAPDCLGNSFFQLPEHKEIAKLLENAKRAIRVYGETRDIVAQLMQKLLEAEKSERTLLLLQILHKMAYSDDVKIVNKNLSAHNSPTEVDRLNSVYQHLLDNYTREIPLQEIAEIANISPPAFCRYFKARTRKTFSGFLLELRISHAAKLLTETNLPISEVCYQSGFNNFSHFNKHF